MIRTEFNLSGGFVGSMENTIYATFAAMLFGAYLLRRMTRYPGVRSMFFLLPSFSIAYGALAMFFVLTRIDYSRFQFLASFALAILWFGFVRVIEPRVRRQRLATVPFGDTAHLTSLSQADWVPLRAPDGIPPGVTGIVADLRAELPSDWERFIAHVSLRGMPVYHSKMIFEAFTGQAPIQHLSENNFGSLLPSSIYIRFKRVLDLAASLAVLPIVILISIPVAAAIWLDDRGPIIFRQKRMGYQGRSFVMLKFRTMRNLEGRAFTEENDPRITRVGRFLRHSRIDELPQIVNIFRGDMSWIGPRPEAIKLSKRYEKKIPFYSYRHIVRPGITGWAQVNQGNVAQVKAATNKLHYDFYYIKNFSPWLDILIIAKTIRIVVTGFGSR